MSRLFSTVLLNCLWCRVASHSWPETPVPRGYRVAKEGGCVHDENGNTEWMGRSICGKDSLALDIKNLRPSNYLSNPCSVTRSEGGYDNEFQMNRVEQGGLMCVSWAANAHDNDDTNNLGGGVRWAISKKSEPTMDDFDQNIITFMPYEAFIGKLLRIPADLEPGIYTMQFLWDWPTGMGPKFLNPSTLNHMYAKCADIEIVKKGDPRAMTLGSHIQEKYLSESCKSGNFSEVNPDNNPPPGRDNIQWDAKPVPGGNTLANPDFEAGLSNWIVLEHQSPSGESFSGDAQIVADALADNGKALALKPSKYGTQVTQTFQCERNAVYEVEVRFRREGYLPNFIVDIQNQRCGEMSCKERGSVDIAQNKTLWEQWNDGQYHDLVYYFKCGDGATRPHPFILILDKHQHEYNGTIFVSYANVYKFGSGSGPSTWAPTSPTVKPTMSPISTPVEDCFQCHNCRQSGEVLPCPAGSYCKGNGVCQGWPGALTDEQEATCCKISAPSSPSAPSTSHPASSDGSRYCGENTYWDGSHCVGECASVSPLNTDILKSVIRNAMQA